ncbi:MAG: aldehyde ferredoxin oxidoreductase [Firmicutes bacterium]|nr:aldehyde ferredoxin oxidoreductase [Bacillota bacterium]MDH7496796.1 aldehyde ferredoxin oxidoreductase C-terminal domain-containing protein [Bacillota bacterium]
MDIVIRVDMSAGTVAVEKAASGYERLGGRALTSRIVLDEVKPTADPLGPRNKLVIAPGLLGGTAASSSGRVSIGAKSPLTGGIKEANAGGTAGHKLARLGIKAIVIEGQPAGGRLYLLKITKRGCELTDAGGLEGLGTFDTVQRLRAEHGNDAGVVAIGQAGEMRMAAACVAVSDPEGRRKFAARGGLGAVMGSKGLKAIVVDDRDAEGVKYADRDAFLALSRDFAKQLMDNPKLGKNYKLYGTAGIVNAVNAIGALPTRNFSCGEFEHATKLSGETLHDTTVARGGRTGIGCMVGCPIMCSNVYVDASGRELVSTLQYENIALLGSNCCIGNLDDVAVLNSLCNDYGLDAIEMGATLAVAMEAGIVPFGDSEGAARLLREIGEGTILGRVLGQGALVTGRVLGVRRVPHAKGQAVPGYDPRSLKGNGVLYATSPMGADHTAGNAFGSRDKVNQLRPDGQKELSRRLQVDAAMLDTMGMCIFARPPLLADREMVPAMLNARYGWRLTAEDIEEMSKEVLRVEKEFNRRAGFTRAHDRLPEWFEDEPLPPHETVFDVDHADLDSVLDF